MKVQFNQGLAFGKTQWDRYKTRPESQSEVKAGALLAANGLEAQSSSSGLKVFKANGLHQLVTTIPGKNQTLSKAVDVLHLAKKAI